MNSYALLHNIYRKESSVWKDWQPGYKARLERDKCRLVCGGRDLPTKSHHPSRSCFPAMPNAMRKFRPAKVGARKRHIITQCRKTIILWWESRKACVNAWCRQAMQNEGGRKNNYGVKNTVKSKSVILNLGVK